MRVGMLLLPCRINARHTQTHTHSVHVQRVHAQVEGRQVHALKHLHQRLLLPLFYVHNLLRVLFHGSLDEAQKVLLVHAGGGVDVRVHLPDDCFKNLIFIAHKAVKSSKKKKKNKFSFRSGSAGSSDSPYGYCRSLGVELFSVPPALSSHLAGCASGTWS